MINELKRPIKDTPISGIKRIAKHQALTIGADLEMRHHCLLIQVDSEGVPLIDKLRTSNLSPEEIEANASNFAAKEHVASTEGVYVKVVMATGQVTGFNISKDLVPAEGEEIITEKEYWQKYVKRKHVQQELYAKIMLLPDSAEKTLVLDEMEEPFSQDLYNMILGSIHSRDNANRW